jgi:hypothetical protein
MSPLRKWMTERRLPTWYSWIVVVLVPVMASMAVLVISLRVNQRSIDRERSARIASEQARIASEQALCRVFVVLDDAYAQAAPTTAAGKKLAAAVAYVRTVNHCAPRTPKAPKR